MNVNLHPANPTTTTAEWTRIEFTHPDPYMALTSFRALFIGRDTDFLESLQMVFAATIAVDGMSEAQATLKETPRNQLPDAIIFDETFDKHKVKIFRKFLADRKMAQKIVILYNDTRSSQEQILFLKMNELVDDTISSSTTKENLVRKIQFLKKVKNSPAQPVWSLKDEIIKTKSFDSKSMIVKRVIDVVFSSLILICCMPVLLLIALAIKLDSPGPVIYHSLRAGRGFKIFRFYKFRTMVTGADKLIDEFDHLNQYHSNESSDAKFVKIANDPRVTRIGKFLRNSSLDELPQLINVLIGDMSLVGNRPLPLYEASTLTTNAHVERFMAPAGITGLWQIKKRGKSDMSVEERVMLDISYARRNNVIYDLWIVANTPAALFQKTNV